MNTLIIRGAEFRYGKTVAPKEGSVIYRAHFRVDMTDPVQQEMGWGEIPSCIASPAKLPGQLAASSMVLRPADDKLQQYERHLDVDSIEDFRAVPLTDKEGDIRGHALELVVKMSSQDSVLALVAVVFALGRATCQLKVKFAKQQKLEELPSEGDQQMRLGEEPEAADADGCELDERDSSDSATTNEGEVEEVGEEGAEGAQTIALPSAVEMAGSTAALRQAKKGRGRQGQKPATDVTQGDMVMRRLEGPCGCIVVTDGADGYLTWAADLTVGGQDLPALRPPEGIPRPLSVFDALKAACEAVEAWGRPILADQSARPEALIAIQAHLDWAAQVANEPETGGIQVVR